MTSKGFIVVTNKNKAVPGTAKPEKTYTTTQLMERWQTNRDTILHHIHSGALLAFDVGRSPSLSDLRRSVASGRTTQLWH